MRTAERVRCRVQRGEVLYWGVLVPLALAVWVARETARAVVEYWPAVLGMVFLGAVGCGFAIVASGATSGDQKMIGALAVAIGSGALGMMSGRCDE